MKDFLKRLKLNENNIGLGAGAVVMVLTGVLLVNYFRSVNKIDRGEKTLSTSTEKSEAVVPEEAKLSPAPQPTETTTEGVANKVEGEYEVKAGDSLWKIAVKSYKDGYKWSKIYDLNKDKIGSNPGKLEIGTKLMMPAEEQKIPVEYTVAKGDNLWNISVKICNDGFVWPKVARDNNLKQPDLIYEGAVLKVTCGRL